MTPILLLAVAMWIGVARWRAARREHGERHLQPVLLRAEGGGLQQRLLIPRQIEELKRGNKLAQETRRWEDSTGMTETMRSKEMAHDYRYFPEPDLVPLIITEEYLSDIHDAMPALPQQLFDKFTRGYG